MRRTATGAIILAEMRAIFCKNTQGTAQQPPRRERGWIMMGWDGKSGEKRSREGEGDFNRVGGRTLRFSTLSPRPIYKARNMCMFLPEGKVKPWRESRRRNSLEATIKSQRQSRPRFLLTSTLHMLCFLVSHIFKKAPLRHAILWTQNHSLGPHFTTITSRWEISQFTARFQTFCFHV